MEESMPIPVEQYDLINLQYHITFECALKSSQKRIDDNEIKMCLTNFRCWYLHVWILPACFFFKALKKF